MTLIVLLTAKNQYSMIMKDFIQRKNVIKGACSILPFDSYNVWGKSNAIYYIAAASLNSPFQASSVAGFGWGSSQFYWQFSVLVWPQGWNSRLWASP